MKRYLGFICFIYSLIIIYVWLFDTLKNYLAPNIQLYLKLSLILLIIMTIVLFFNNNNNYKFKVSDLVLLLPLLMLLLSGDGRLSSSLAQNRMANYNREATTNIIDNNENNENEKEKNNEEPKKNKKEKKYDFTKVDFNVVDASYYDLANYFTFIPSAKKYVGKTIRVRGFTMLNDKYIPDGYFNIGKYNIACCAADAIYVGFYVKKEDFEIKDNTWYQIEGVIEEAIDTEGMETTAIKIINIKEIDSKKEDQYVYPCYAYDNGSCKEISKYDIGY